jgi:hypothetical protein
VHLVDVIQGHVGLVAVARAKLEEQHVTYGLVSQVQRFALDLIANSSGVHSGACNTKAGWLKFDGPVLERVVQYLHLDLLRR